MLPTGHKVLTGPSHSRRLRVAAEPEAQAAPRGLELSYNPAGHAMLVAGTLLHRRYRVVRLVARGGMGAVYEAVDCRLHNTVAVKETTLTGPEIDRAFQREARLLAGLRHPALPVVIDYFVETSGQFLVMQFIEGEDLARLLERQGCPLAQDDVLAVAWVLLDALNYLHDRNPPIVHRDVKPANLKRTPRGEIVLLDFGLAKGWLEFETRPSVEQSVFGFTPRYAPPEQIDGLGTDTRSDVYACGATLYHLLTNVAPPTAVERAAAVAAGRADPLREARILNARVDEALSSVITTAMELDPARRFPSALEMRSALFGREGDEPPRRSLPAVASGARRVDAALPSQAVVGTPIDLIVQVRFAGSPLLGLEDWPTRKRPSQVEQASEAVELAYPVDVNTGKLMPARLRIKVVAPDFVIEGQAEQLLDVPPDEYSRRLDFLVTPRRAGYCRVNVEVYGPEALYLGTIPVETEATGAAVAMADVSVANLVLGLLSRQMVDLLARPDAAVIARLEAPAAAGPVAPGLADVGAPIARASPARPDTRGWLAQVAQKRAARVAAEVARAQQALAAGRLGEADVAADTAAMLDPEDAAVVALLRQLADRGVRPHEASRWEHATPAARPRVRRILAVAPVAVALLAAVVVWQSWTPRGMPAAPPPPAAPGAASTPRVEDAAAAPIPGERRMSVPPAADLQGPPPPPGRPAGRPPASSAATGRQVWVASANRPGVLLAVVVERPQPGRLRASLRVVNESPAPVEVAFDYARTHLSETTGAIHAVVADSAATPPRGLFTVTLAPGGFLDHWIEFDAPRPVTDPVDLTLAPPTGTAGPAKFPVTTVVPRD